MAENYDIEEIERYLENRMEATELQSFEQRMEKSAALKEETQAYRRVLAGLYTLGSERFHREVQHWEQEWINADTDDSELIEWYLNDRLGQAGKVMVRGRINTDAGFARAVEQQRSLKRGFDALQSEQFEAKVRKWEFGNGSSEVENSRQSAGDSPQSAVGSRQSAGGSPQSAVDSPQSAVGSRQPVKGRVVFLRRMAAAVAVLLVIATVLFWYADGSYSRQAITQQFYQPISSEATMSMEEQNTTQLAEALESAHQLMQEKQYEAAFLAFNRLLGQIDNTQLDDFNRQYFTEQAEWQRLLAAQTMSPPPLELKKEALRIARTDGHDFQEEAAQLLEKMNSFLYSLVN